jgi:DNA-binding IclR family transcriptional regulator
VLRLFDEAHPSLTVPEMAELTGFPASSIYRHVRELLAEEFLESTVDSRYRLGSAFIDFTRRVRVTDPLLLVGSELLHVLVEQVRVPVHVLLCRLYGDQVMCVAVDKSDRVGFSTSYELCRPMPLVRGATSKAILANMPPRALKKLLSAVETDSTQQQALDQALAQTRRTGYCITSGEVDDGLTGMAAMVQNVSLGVSASLSLIGEAAMLTKDQQTQVLPLLLSTASVINTRLSEEAAGLPEKKVRRRPPSADVEAGQGNAPA